MTTMMNVYTMQQYIDKNMNRATKSDDVIVIVSYIVFDCISTH